MADRSRQRYQLTYVKIEVVCAQSLQRLFQALGDVRLVGVPELAGKENLFSRNAAVLDALADLMFVA